MERILRLIGMSVFFFAVIYCIIAYIMLDKHAVNWEDFVRFFHVIFSILFAMIYDGRNGETSDDE